MHLPAAKVVILGAQGVGKTCFIQRYVNHLFEQHTSPTIGASFFSCKVVVDEYELEMLIWDTAGQERFKSMAPMYYRNANAAILMFDITSFSSYESMKEWVNELKTRVEDPIMLYVVGNKCDKNTFRQVGYKEAADYAISIGALYHEASALSSEGVKDVFIDMAQELVRAKLSKLMPRDGVFRNAGIIRVSENGNNNPENPDGVEHSYLCC